MLDNLQQRPAWNDLEVAGKGSLDGVLGRDEDPLVAKVAQSASRDEHTVDVAHRSIQRELTEEGATRRSRAAGAGQHDRECDRQVKRASFLAQLRGGEIYRQA